MKNKGLLVAGLAFLIAGSAYLLLSKKSFSSNGQSSDNFSSLKTNLGSNRSGDNPVIVKFASGNYQCDFYSNGRFVLSKNKKMLAKGSYSNGGKSMVIDGGGNSANSESVWANLGTLIK